MVQNKRHFRPEECCELNDIQIHVLAASPTVTLHGAIVMTCSLSFCFLVRSLLPTHCRCRELLYLSTLIDTNTFSRTPLQGRSASSRDHYPTEHIIQEKTDVCTAGWIFFTNIFFFQVHCVHSSIHVTDTVSIVLKSVFIGRGTYVVSLPHTTVPFDPPLSPTL